MLAQILNGLGIAERQTKKKDRLRQQRGDRHYRKERQPSRANVVRTAERPDEIKIDDTVTLVAAEEFGPNDCSEDKYDDRCYTVEIGVRWQVELLSGTRTADPFCRTGDQRHDERNSRQHTKKEERQNLRSASPTQPHRDANSILVDRLP